MKYRLSKTLVATILLFAARNTLANVYYPDDATIDSFVGSGGNTFGLVVGYADDTDYMNHTNGTSPTVTLVDGADLPDEMSAQNGSTIDVKGGYADALGATDSATINLSGGDVSTMGAGSNATINISGGTMDYGPFTLDTSTLIMSGGEVGTANNGEANVTLEDQSTGLLDGGKIDSNVSISGFATAMASNITIVGGVVMTNSSSFTMSSGSIGYLSINNYSSATVTGGTIVGSMESFSGATSTASAATIGGVTGFAGTINLSTANVTGSVDASLGVVNVFSGAIGGNATADTYSVEGNPVGLTLDGGVTVGGYVSATNIGGIAIFNATITGDVEAHQQGAVGMSDGTINGGVNTYDTGSFILDGGTVNGDLHAYNQSTITIDGGAITGTLTDNGAQYYSSNNGITITAGTIANLAASDWRDVLMSGGTVQNSLTAQSHSTFNLTGGSVNGTATSYDSSTIQINGATVTNIVSHDYSYVDLLSGTINGSIQVHDYSSVNISGGNVYGFLNADGYGDSSLSGGRIGNDAALSTNAFFSISGTGTIGGNLTAHNFADVNMSGGTITGNADFYDNSGFYWSGGHVQGIISMHDQSFLDWTGGTFGSNNTGPHTVLANADMAPADSPDDTSTPIYVYDSATLEVDGINLSPTLVNGNANGFSVYNLAGYFGDGSSLSSNLQIYIQNPTSTTSGGSLQLGHAQQQWNIPTGGSWATAANWLANVVPNEPGALVTFTDTASVENPTDNHVALDGAVTLGTLTFNTANNIILDPGNGGSLTVNNQTTPATIYVAASNPQINVPLIFQSNTTITVGPRYDEGVRIANSSVSSSSIYGGNISFTINTGLTIPAGINITKEGYNPLYTTFVRGDTLNINEGTVQILPNGTSTGTSRLSSLNIMYGGTLDLTNNDLILDYTPGNSPLNLIAVYISYGFDGGYWDRYGIISSTAGADPTFSTALGYADNSVLGLKTFDGQTVNSNVILIKYTWVGDANLDGVVNSADLAAMSPIGTTWNTGDFNYDDKVNADDYGIFMLGAALSGGLNISTTLPEPTSVIMTMTAVALVCRRRRH